VAELSNVYEAHANAVLQLIVRDEPLVLQHLNAHDAALNQRLVETAHAQLFQQFLQHDSGEIWLRGVGHHVQM
jgi:hypothetical protein